MAFDSIKEHSENIQDDAQAYFESSVDYYKLRGFKVAMKSTSMILKFTLILLGFSMFFLFCSLAAAFAIGIYLNNYAFGFLIVGGVYLVLTGILFLIKPKMIERSIIEKFSEICFND